MIFGDPTPQTSKPVSIPAPVQGLNAYDSLAAMAETYAIALQNWWPQPYGCSVRKGYVEWATDMPATVETIAGWYDLDGDERLFAWSFDSMYDISTRAVVGAAMVTGLTSARWETVLLTNSAGNFLICVNGEDDGIIYRPTGVFRITAGDGIVANTWAGLDPVDAVQVCVHQRRLWAVEKNSSRAWYLPADAIQGTFVAFDFGPQFSKGGFLQALMTWTLDDGNGAEDHLIGLSSNGEAVVYAGTDPNDADFWELVGVYYIGAPVAGRRFFTKAGGDQLILTQRGVISMTAELVSTKVQDAETKLPSKNVQFLLQELAQTYYALNGWQLVFHAQQNMLLLNIPSITAGSGVQLAANMITNAWTQFTNMDGACWCSHNNELYFGDYLGVVHQAWTGYSDAVLLDNTGGEGVTCVAQQAYSYFGAQTTQKQIGMYRPLFLSSGDVSYSAAIVYNFGDIDVQSPTAVAAAVGSLWGTALWGQGLWSGGVRVKQEWSSANGMGMSASIKMVTLTATEVLWVTTDYNVVYGSGIF